MAAECKRYHRLAELVATKKGENYATNMSWIKARVSFALLRWASLCLRGSRAKRRIHLEYCRTLTLTSRKDKGIFVKNIEDDILLLTFYCFSLVDFYFWSYYLTSYYFSFAISMLILEDWNFHARNPVSQNAVLKHCNLGFTSVTTEEKKDFDFEVSHLE